MRLNALESDTARRKTLLAEPVRENAVIRDVLRKKTGGAPARRELCAN